MSSPRLVAALPLVVAALALPVAPAAAKPPLTVSATPAAVAPGDKLTIRYTVAKRPARLVVRLGDHRLASLKAKARGRLEAKIPASLTPGRYRLTGCVRKRCRTAKTVVVVKRPEQRPAPGPAPAPPAAPPATPAPAPDFSGPADPLEVSARTDAGRSAAKTIGMAGGTLSTTGADGTKYTLEVPEFALLSDERITMTPLTAVDGLPFSGGLTAGVQLEPSGLRFVQPVRVTISGHAPVAPEKQTAFLYQTDGEEFQLYPFADDPSKTSFQLLHFSGVGVGSATDADRNAQLLRANSDHEGRLTQELSEIVRLDRVYQLTGQGQPLDVRRLEAALRAYHDQSLKPLVDAALTDDNLAIGAINHLLGWNRISYLMAGEDFMAAERDALMDKMITIMKNAAIKAHRRCVDESRPEELPMILSWWRQLSLLGVQDQMPYELFDAIKSCARFELDFATKLRQQRGWGGPEGPEVWTAEAEVENLIIEPDPLTLQQSGTKVAEYLDFTITVPAHPPGTGCWYGSDEWETTFPFTVTQLEMDLNPIQKPDGTYGYPELSRGAIRLSILPFSTKEWVYLSDCNGTSEPWADNFLGVTWYELHESEMDEYGGVVVTDWTTPAGGGSLMGAKTYFRTMNFSGFPTDEETTIELYHAPVG